MALSHTCAKEEKEENNDKKSVGEMMFEDHEVLPMFRAPGSVSIICQARRKTKAKAMGDKCKK